MAYQTGQTTGAADLLTKLVTFAAANGWISDDAVASNKAAMHKNSVYVSFRYDAADTTGSQIVSIHQALGHTVSNLPGDHPDDSGSGYNSTSSVSSTNLDNERHVDLGLSAGELPSAYYFFEQDASPAYIHVVVAKADGSHRHFGFGELEMFGSWTGGEYCYGHWVGSSSSLATNSIFHSALLDGRFNASSSGNPEMCATLHIDGFPGEVAASKWGEVKAAKAGATAPDTAGNVRFPIQGGYRGGPMMYGLGNFAVNRASGFINLIPVGIFSYEAGTPATVRYLGELPDVRGIILDGIAPGEELAVGTETWVCFPSVQKSVAIGTGLTLYQGIAYRKETA